MLGKLAVRSIIKITTFAKQKIKFSTSTFINFRASRHDIQNFKNREGWNSKNYNVQRNFYKKLLSSTEKSRKIHENRYFWKIIVHLFSKKTLKVKWQTWLKKAEMCCIFSNQFSNIVSNLERLNLDRSS